MKKVDLIYSGWLTAPNGVSSFLQSFKYGRALLSDIGIDLTMYTSDQIVTRNFEKQSKTLKSKFIAIAKRYVPYSKTLTTIFLKKIEQNNINIIKTYIEKNSVSDVVFFHELLSCYHYLKNRKNHSPKVILVLHTNGDTFKMLRIYYPKLVQTKYYTYLKEVEKTVLSNIDKLGFVSEKSKNNFSFLNPNFDKGRLFHVLNGIGSFDTTKSKITYESSPKYKICCVGSITKRKGQELIIRAYSKLPKYIQNDISITFLGGGDQLEFLSNFTKSEDIDKNIHFMGSVNNVKKYLQDSNIFILTSYDEGLPISIIEAMQLGLPIIATDVGGISEMVKDKFNGFLINPDEKEILDVFKNLSTHDLNQFGINSYNLYKEKFTSDKMLFNYGAIFKELGNE